METLAAEEKKEKRKFRPVDLPMSLESHGLTDEVLHNFMEAEGQMNANDRMEKERVDAKNSLEEYVYDLRGKLQDEGQLSRYVEAADLNKLDTLLSDVSAILKILAFIPVSLTMLTMSADFD